MKVVLTVLFAIVICGVSLGGYEYGHTQGLNTGKNLGWQRGYDKGSKDGMNSLGSALIDDSTKITDLTNQYNQLSDNYNNLRSAVITYAGTAGTYKASTRISCTSNDVGSYTYTSCY